jgi:predicted DNA-binding transcriptional regulator AlpA
MIVVSGEMETAAREAVAQGWCEPEVSSQVMDPVLALAISKPVSRALQAWYDTAAQHARNEDYYRKLLEEIGDMFGKEARTSDDGSVQQDVLCAKVPALVRTVADPFIRMVSPKEFADLLGISKRSLLYLAATGRIPRPKEITPKIFRWSIVDVKMYLSSLQPRKPSNDQEKEAGPE